MLACVKRSSGILALLCGLALPLAGAALAAPPQTATPAAKPSVQAAPAKPGQAVAQSATAPAPANPAQALAAKVQQRYQQVQGLAADYQRKSLFVATGSDSERTVEGQGRLLWGRPIDLRLEQDEPRREIIVAHGPQVWWVRPDRGRADLYPLDRFTSGLRSLLDALGGLAKVDEAFVVEPPQPGEAPEGEEVQTLALRPKETRADLKRLVLWFDAKDLLLKGFRTTSIIGDVTEYQFSAVQANPRLTVDSFQYNPPADYKVTDHRPLNPGAQGN